MKIQIAHKTSEISSFYVIVLKLPPFPPMQTHKLEVSFATVHAYSAMATAKSQLSINLFGIIPIIRISFFKPSNDHCLFGNTTSTLSI